jgi:uncharacterized protein (DUF427 family)
MKAIFNNQVIAESDETVEVEGNYYFPADAVKKEFLRPSNLRSACPWKGKASYYSVEVKGRKENDAAWYYAEPKPAAEDIKGMIAFWKGVDVVQ